MDVPNLMPTKPDLFYFVVVLIQQFDTKNF